MTCLMRHSLGVLGMQCRMALLPQPDGEATAIGADGAKMLPAAGAARSK